MSSQPGRVSAVGGDASVSQRPNASQLPTCPQKAKNRCNAHGQRSDNTWMGLPWTDQSKNRQLVSPSSAPSSTCGLSKLPLPQSYSPTWVPPARQAGQVEPAGNLRACYRSATQLKLPCPHQELRQTGQIGSPTPIYLLCATVLECCYFPTWNSTNGLNV